MAKKKKSGSWKLAIPILLLSPSLWAQTIETGGAGGVPHTTVAGLPGYTSVGLVVVTNGSTTTDCSTGGDPDT